MNGSLSPLLRSWRFSVVKKHVKGDVLDYGCGVGYLPHYIKGISSYVGVDVNDGDLAIAQNAMHSSGLNPISTSVEDMAPATFI